MESDNPWWSRGRDSVASNGIWKSTASTSLSFRLANLANPVFMSALASFCLAVKHKCFLSLYLQVCMSACRPLCPVCLWKTLPCLPMDNYVLSPVLYSFMLILSPVVYIILSLLYSIFCFRLSFYIKGEHANFLLVRKSQIRKFLRCASPQMANPQIGLVSQSANRKSIKLLSQKQCFWSDSHWLASKVFSLPLPILD